MNPSVEDRLNSVVRAIGGVILPALPESASLAREQAMLAMGHIQIILAQLPATAAFEDEEANDLHRLGLSVSGVAAGGQSTTSATAALITVLEDAGHRAASDRTSRVQNAIDAVLLALVEDGDPVSAKAVHEIVLDRGAARAREDRQWFAAMGFDSDFSAG
jgi:hypothetical protein